MKQAMHTKLYISQLKFTKSENSDFTNNNSYFFVTLRIKKEYFA